MAGRGEAARSALPPVQTWLVSSYLASEMLFKQVCLTPCCCLLARPHTLGSDALVTVDYETAGFGEAAWLLFREAHSSWRNPAIPA